MDIMGVIIPLLVCEHFFWLKTENFAKKRSLEALAGASRNAAQVVHLIEKSISEKSVTWPLNYHCLTAGELNCAEE